MASINWQERALSVYAQALGYTDEEMKEWHEECRILEEAYQKRKAKEGVLRSSADVVRESFRMAKRGE